MDNKTFVETTEIPGPVVSIGEKNDDTATVCHARIHVDRFQKGFNYFFKDLSTGEILLTPDD